MTTLQPAPVVVDTTVDLVCVVTGDIPIDIVWEHVLTDGSVEEVFTGNDTIGGKFTLTVNIDDYGTYQCNASSRFGIDSSSIDIIQAGNRKRCYTIPVFMIPSFSTVGPVISAPKDSKVATGIPLILSVNITEFNLPLTDITWFIDGTLATEANERVTITNTSTASPPASSTLTLDPVQFPAEDGLYSVTAVNPAGMVTTAFNVTIYCKTNYRMIISRGASGYSIVFWFVIHTL